MMAAVVPSQVVEYIKTRFPQAENPDFWLGIDYAPAVAHTLALLESIPSHLVIFQGTAAAEFGEAVSALQIAASRWQAGEKTCGIQRLSGASSNPSHSFALQAFSFSP